MNFYVTLGYGLLFIVSCQAYAIESYSPTSLSLGVSLLDFDHREFTDNGRLLNSETGQLSGAIMRFGHRSRFGNISATFSAHSNAVDYQGYTQAGFPVATRTYEKIIDFYSHIERPFQIANQIDYSLYVGLGYRYWERDIQSTATAYGLLETYQWGYGLMGIRKEVAMTQSSAWSFDYRLVYPINPKMEIDAHTLFDKKVIYLSGQVGDQVSIAWRYSFYNRLNMTIQPYVERWRFNHSQTEVMTRQGIKMGYIIEPRSRTIVQGVMIYLGYAF